MQEIRPYIRWEPSPPDAVIVVRGGSEGVEKLRRHAVRTRRAFLLDGEPLYGLSAYCVPDELLK